MIHSAFRRKSLRKSIIRRLRGWKNGKGGNVINGTMEETTVAEVEEGPRLIAAARVLIIDSTANVELASFVSLKFIYLFQLKMLAVAFSG